MLTAWRVFRKWKAFNELVPKYFLKVEEEIYHASKQKLRDKVYSGKVRHFL